jgi:hypothetical protein
MVPNYAQPGVKICVLFGSDVPVLLQREFGDRFSMVGIAYGPTVVFGQVIDKMENGEAEKMTFSLI